MKYNPLGDSFSKTVAYATQGAQMQPISQHCYLAVVLAFLELPAV